MVPFLLGPTKKPLVDDIIPSSNLAYGYKVDFSTKLILAIRQKGETNFKSLQQHLEAQIN
jgi:hypothetical protein